MDAIATALSSNRGVFDLLFKLFVEVGSVLYLIYALVLYKQTKLMLRAIEESGALIIRAASFLQILFAIFLIILSFGII